MQGRLLPKYNGHYQAHPVGYWQEEFSIAAQLGLDCIEFILDYDHYEENPLMFDSGIQKIRSISEQTGVQVLSVCADYFMEAPIHSDNEQIAVRSTEVLVGLLNAAVKLNIKNIVIPCVDQSSIKDERLRDRFKEVLRSIVPVAEKYEVNLSLETDLNPYQFERLLTNLDSPMVTVNYDIGNSAALGYNPLEELDAYGDRITDIHIKDRLFGGESVVLGEGDSKFELFFEKLKYFNYQGPFIIQAYRDDDGLDIFKRQLHWLNDVLKEVKYS
ncbi:TIM barrel protein [candidate division KSB1 bacterium]|nr:TIM barrel protein [candidate division KSB1 bacterium]